MLNSPLVSIIIATKNEAVNLPYLLSSLRQQSYPSLEIIVVDNFSTDQTAQIAKSFTIIFYEKGPERSNQRNFGANQGLGEFLLFLDADMILSQKVVLECVDKISQNPELGGLIIPEISQGRNFWGKCKAMEKGFYQGVEWLEAARFFRKSVFWEVGGFLNDLVSGEDWDLSQRVALKFRLGKITAPIYHEEDSPTLWQIFQKKFYYGQYLEFYFAGNSSPNNIKRQQSLLQRFRLFFSQPKTLFQSPALGAGLIFLKSWEFLALGLGFLTRRILKKTE